MTRDVSFPNSITFHSPIFWNSGKRRAGVVFPSAGKSCCIKPFLWAFSSSILFSVAFINASIEERQSAVFCCSLVSLGIGKDKRMNWFLERLNRIAPCANLLIFLRYIGLWNRYLANRGYNWFISCGLKIKQKLLR